MKIENTQVYGFGAAIRAIKNPKLLISFKLFETVLKNKVFTNFIKT